MNKYVSHFKTITLHKYYVFKFMCNAGLPIQGLIHDMSKYHPVEFFSSARYFSGDRSPIDNEKVEKGYSLAWQHHKGHNPHHPEYWLDNLTKPGEEPIPIIMPYSYAVEMICDWLAAGIVYEKEAWTHDTPMNWFKNVGCKRRIHPAILHFAYIVLDNIKRYKSLNCINKSWLEFLYDDCIYEFNMGFVFNPMEVFEYDE